MKSRTLRQQLLGCATLFSLSGLMVPVTLLTAPTAVQAMERDEQRATVREAQALFERASRLLDKEGPEKAFRAFNEPNGAFVTKDLYVFVIDTLGNYVANGAANGLIGSNVLETRDAAGNPLFRNMIEATKKESEARLRYVWLNRKDNVVEPKVTFLHRNGNYILGVGYYAPRSSASEAKAMLEKAVTLVQQEGMSKASAAFNQKKGNFIHNDLYVFAVNLNSGKFEAMGINPVMTGSDARKLVDVQGKPLVEEMIALARKQGEGSVRYTWTNPVTNAIEKKETFIRRVGNSLVGVGYYQE